MVLILICQGIEYVRNMQCEDYLRATAAPAAYKSWQDTFQTSDRGEAEAAVSAATCRLRFREPDGACSWTSRRSAFAQCPSAGREVLMNQLNALHGSWMEPIYGDAGFFGGGTGGTDGADGAGDKAAAPAAPATAPAAAGGAGRLPLSHTRWGSGEEFSAEELAAFRAVVERHTEEVDLATGDLVVLDNFRWTHGRAPYEGDRRLLVCMSEAQPRETAHIPLGLR